jgi:CubicO group peptidase (beta-lactamase class C family)
MDDGAIAELMRRGDVPGLALALVAGGAVERLAYLGVRSVRTQAPVDARTVFEAASLTKPVFAAAVRKLVDAGTLSLDTRLADHVPGYIPTDPRAATITVAHALSHSGGLPNWSNPDHPLRTYFAPGGRFSYSGEGFVWLQKAVEAITGETAEALVEQLVLAPLGMTDSSLVWQKRFAATRAEPHNSALVPRLAFKPGEANVAYSLQTTAADYARFLLAELRGERAWLRPQIAVRHRGHECLEPHPDDVETGVAWSLGWGVEPAQGTFFHWGDNGTFKCFALGAPAEHRALVAFTNGNNGLAIMPDLVAGFFPGARPSLAWLDYERHDSPRRRFLKDALARGLEPAWAARDPGLDVDSLRNTARELDAYGRIADAQALKQRAQDLARADKR